MYDAILDGKIKDLHGNSYHKREKQFDKIMKLFGYANPYRMLGLCQQIADIQGETLTINVPFPEVFYYKM